MGTAALPQPCFRQALVVEDFAHLLTLTQAVISSASATRKHTRQPRKTRFIVGMYPRKLYRSA